MKWYVLAVAMPLLLAGCGSSPPTHFFTLNPVPPAAGAPPVHAKDPPVQVGDVQLPPTLDRLEMVLRGPGTQVQVLGSDRWAAPLKGLVQETMTQDLRDRLGDSAVLAPGTPAQPGKVQILLLTFQEFSADASGRVTLDASWAVGRGNPPKPVLNRQTTLHVNAGSTTPGAVAEGMSRALGALADRIAAAL